LVVESTLQNSARAFLDLYSECTVSLRLLKGHILSFAMMKAVECTVSLRLLKGHILAGTMATVQWLQYTSYRTLATVATVLAIQWLQYTSYSTIAGTMATVH
jgi:hypothetical protein